MRFTLQDAVDEMVKLARYISTGRVMQFHVVMRTVALEEKFRLKLVAFADVPMHRATDRPQQPRLHEFLLADIRRPRSFQLQCGAILKLDQRHSEVFDVKLRALFLREA